jgi:hypothetical protein
MLRLQGGQQESLWDEALPERLRELPEDLTQIEMLLRDEALLAPIEAHWDREAQARGRSAKRHGRPTSATPWTTTLCRREKPCASSCTVPAKTNTCACRKLGS